jgi:hypothetical protein
VRPGFAIDPARSVSCPAGRGGDTLPAPHRVFMRAMAWCTSTIIMTDRAQPAFIPGECYGTGGCTTRGGNHVGSAAMNVGQAGCSMASRASFQCKPQQLSEGALGVRR